MDGWSVVKVMRRSRLCLSLAVLPYRRQLQRTLDRERERSFDSSIEFVPHSVQNLKKPAWTSIGDHSSVDRQGCTDDVGCLVRANEHAALRWTWGISLRAPAG